MNLPYIPIGEDYLIYSPLQGLAALVNGEAFHCLRKRGLSAGLKNRDGSLEQLHKRLKDPGEPEPSPRSGPFEPHFLGLITTRGCNMSCSYCDFHDPEKDPEIMGISIALQALGWMADQEVRRGTRFLNIHFFGGEPFLSIDWMKQVVEEAGGLARKRGLQVRFVACTNGVMNEEDALWVRDHFDSIVLSMDGPAEVQNKYRPLKGKGDSFSTLNRNAKIFGEGRLDFVIRICVLDQTLSRLEDTVQFFSREYGPSAIVLESLRDSDAVSKGSFGPPNPWEFARRFAHASIMAESLGVKLVHSTCRLDKTQSSFCPVANDGFIIDPQGRISSCYQLEGEWLRQGLSLYFGRISPQGKVHIDEEALARIRSLVVQNKPRCRSCFCKWHCAGGCHILHTPPGGSEEYSDLCHQTRSITVWKILHSLDLEVVAERFLEHPRVEGDGVLEFPEI